MSSHDTKEGVPIRTLLWHWGRRGGGPRYTLELAKALALQPGLEVHLSLSRQSELFQEFHQLGLPGWHIDTYQDMGSAVLASLHIPRIRRAFTRYLQEQEIQVVLCTMIHIWNVFMVNHFRGHGIRYLLAVHDAVPHAGEAHFIRGFLLRREIRAADGIIALSEHVRRQTLEICALPSERMWVIPHGVFGAGEIGQRQGVQEIHALRLLFFGRLLPYKGLDLLLDAFELLQRKFPELELTIAGPGDLGPIAQRIACLSHVQVDNRWIPEGEMAAVFAGADLVILPYHEASQSGVAALAYGSGLPVVATPVGGLTEQVRHGHTGLIAESVTGEAIAAAVERMMLQPGLYSHCTEQVWCFANESLSWERIGSQVTNAIRDLVCPCQAASSSNS